MREWKNKEVTAGLIVIIILGSIALFLLIRRELKYSEVWKENVVLELKEHDFQQKEESKQSIPEEETKSSITENDKKESSKKDSYSNVQAINNSSKAEDLKEKNQKKQIYSIFGEEKYKPAVLTERKIEDKQLKELYEVWADYKLNAVGDLIRLERFQQISEELKNTGKFYYYGSVDRLGRPSGKGLAVYEDNSYYYGDWKEGVRHGKGMWLEVAIYNNSEKTIENLGVVEHSYNGQWSKDLPNGEGQEHFGYDYEILEEESLEHQKAISNVIGCFKDGYYHGEMYIMTTDADGDSFDWKGNCQNGVWDIIMEGNTTHAVWEDYERDENQEIRYYYMFPEENEDWGIIGLKK